MNDGRMNKVPFGLRSDGTWRNAYDVLRGMECQCVCPVCGSGLVAKQGKVSCLAFRPCPLRALGTEREGGCAEATIHKAAKEILWASSGKTIFLPRVPEFEIGGSRGEFRCQLLRCELEVLIEKINRRVDVLATTQIVRDPWPEQGIERVRRRGGPLIIEINVSNPKDDVYVHDLSSAELSAVEITLSAEDVFTEIGKGKGDRLSALKRLVLGPRSANRRWLNFDPGLLGRWQMRRAE